ncbi:ATP-dependent DNA helicase PIF1-like protein [Tanacetum coccineum]
MIGIPNDILIKDCADPVGALVSFVYPSILSNLNDTTYFQERAILAPIHEVVKFINFFHYFLVKRKFTSLQIGLIDNFNESLYSPDVLNGMKLVGLPNYRLLLNVGAPVMLLRNMDLNEGLCNGTRLRIKELRGCAIKVKNLTRTKVGQTVSLTKLTHSDKRLPLQINRRQYPISVSFAMTINKSQGQSLSKVGI